MKYTAQFHYPSFSSCKDIDQNVTYTIWPVWLWKAGQEYHLLTHPNIFLMKEDAKFNDPSFNICEDITN